MMVSDTGSPLEDPSQNGFFVKFWGTRGSIPTPGFRTRKYGGNTSCVEVRVDGTLLICDGGTGLRDLGVELIEQPLRADDWDGMRRVFPQAFDLLQVCKDSFHAMFRLPRHFWHSLCKQLHKQKELQGVGLCHAHQRDGTSCNAYGKSK